MNAATAANLPANQARFGFDEIALDFGHNTAPEKDGDGNPLPPKEPREIAGMGTLVVEEGVGIVYLPTSWTPEGEHFYTGRHYKDLSPTVGKNDKGEVEFIHSVALTRHGQIRDLHAYSSGAKSFSKLKLSSLQTVIKMDTPLDFRALLATLLGLDPASVTDEAIISAAETAQPLSAETTEKKDDPAAPAVEPKGATDLSALSARIDAMERNGIVDAATAAGKVIPLSAEEIAATPVLTLRAMVNRIVPTVALSAKTTSTEPPTTKALSAEQKTIADKLGLSEAQREKMLK